MTVSKTKLDILAAYSLGLSRLDRDLRSFSLGGSDVNIIVNGTDWQIANLIAVKRQEIEPEDITHNIPVIMGIWTEDLNQIIYQDIHETEVWDRGVTVDHPTQPHYRCSLDGRTHHPGQSRPGLWEAKWTSQTNLETITKYYMPQCQHNMDVCDADYIVLSVLMGGRYDAVVVERDRNYLEHLRARTEMVWDAVQSLDGRLSGPLPAMPKPKLPPVFLQSKPVDLATLPVANEIGDLAPDYLRTYEAAKLHKKVEGKIKALIPEDAETGGGLGLSFKRNQAGALTLKPAPVVTNDNEPLTY